VTGVLSLIVVWTKDNLGTLREVDLYFFIGDEAVLLRFLEVEVEGERRIERGFFERDFRIIDLLEE